MIVAIVLIILLFPLAYKKYSESLEIDKYRSYSLRGVLAVLIVLFHCSYWLPQNQINILFLRGIGSWICGIFFIFSGYGMYLQKEKIQNQNFSLFYKTRIAKVLHDYLILIVINIILQILYGRFSLLYMLRELKYGDTDSLLPYSWFIILLIIYHSLFYFIIRKRNTLALIWIVSLIISLILMLLPWGCHWYTSALAFPVGVTISRFSKLPITKSQFLGMAFLTLVLLIIGLYVHENFYVFLITPLVSFSIINVLIHLPGKLYPVIYPLAKYSFYIYMIQGIVIKVILLDFPCSDLEFLVLALGLTLLFAFLYERTKKLIMK